MIPSFSFLAKTAVCVAGILGRICTMRTALLLILVSGAVVVSAGVAGAVASDEKAAGHPYTNADLGFTYTPPGGLRDLTEAFKESVSARNGDGNVRFESLLRMFSGPDNQAADWVSLGIATLPRGRDKDKGDDVTAGFFTNNALGGGATTKREVVKIAGRDFSVSNFEKTGPPCHEICRHLHRGAQRKIHFFFLFGK